MPRERFLFACMTDPIQFDEHTAFVTHQRLDPMTQALERRGERQRARQKPGFDATRQAPDHQMTQIAGESRVKRHSPRCWISPREQLEVGNITAAEPSRSDRRGKSVLTKIEPPVGRGPGIPFESLQGLSQISKYSSDRRQAWRPGTGTDTHVNGAQVLELRQIPVDDG